MGKAKLKTIATVSAGGVIYRRLANGSYEIVLVGQSRIARWGLPKGAPAPGESLQEAALREVKEETGIEGRVIADLGHIEYWFGVRGVRYHKTVHFFLMEALRGDTSEHDFEHDMVAWFSIPEAHSTMSYANEKEILRRADDVLAGPERTAT